MKSALVFQLGRKRKLTSKIATLLILFLFFANVFAIQQAQPTLLSINFQHIETKKALQYLAKIANKNIILSDSIKGTLTIEINALPWTQVFNLILKTKNLNYRYLQDILFIAPFSEISNQRKQEFLATQQDTEFAPLSSALIPVKYGQASELVKLLKERGHSLLSSHGTVSFDTRTNTIWIEDNDKKLAEVKSLISKLDTPVKQVLIEARIINVDTNYESELGIKFNALGSSKPTNQPCEANKQQNFLHMGLPKNHSPTHQHRHCTLQARQKYAA